MAKKRKNFLDLQAARKWAVAQQLSGKAAWAKLKRETGLPTNIPSNPQATYGEEFKRRGGWGWFLGTGNQRPEDMIWISFLEARAWARESIAKSQTSWVKASKTPGWLPNGIPANPPQVYRKDWTIWG